MAKSSKNKKTWVSVVTLVIVAALLLFAPESLLVELGLAEPAPVVSPAEGAVTAYVMDVGQGDSILLLSPNGKTMLVDASESGAFDAISATLSELNITKLDVVVATHPHNDHIGGMTKIINNYEIGTFYLPEVTHTSATFERMLTALEDKGVPTVAAQGSSRALIDWDPDVEVRILSPLAGESYEDLNNWSVVLRVKYGQTSMLLTGDAESYAEGLMLDALPPALLQATVLKLGHHGSSSSTSEDFFLAVDPQIAIASLGEGNDYGHPHHEIVELLDKYNIPLYRTDTMGTIAVVLDGTEVTLATER